MVETATLVILDARLVTAGSPHHHTTPHHTTPHHTSPHLGVISCIASNQPPKLAATTRWVFEIPLVKQQRWSLSFLAEERAFDSNVIHAARQLCSSRSFILPVDSIGEEDIHKLDAV
ncbi:hypothetical protein TcWFU_003786 [Taenia crassiceps]|uniref:Uncharacterized protein n=1 Tax=Taenia crassiceps TaxID=6207 RepID=A0ABR4QCY3_9CEST